MKSAESQARDVVLCDGGGPAAQEWCGKTATVLCSAMRTAERSVLFRHIAGGVVEWFACDDPKHQIGSFVTTDIKYGDSDESRG